MLLAVGALAAAGLTGCRGDRKDDPPRQFFPDLDDQQKWAPQGESEFFVDGRMMRQPVAGTVPFGPQPFAANEEWASKWNTQRADLLKDDPAFYFGVESVNADGTVVYLAKIPAAVTVDRAMLERGMERFNIYCTACHGYLGDGQGMVAKAGFNPIIPSFYDPTFADPKNVRSRDGWIFHTIRNGKPTEGQPGKYNMPAYGHAVNERDAWAITAYVRALQASREGTIDDVPQALREELLRKRGNPAPAQTGGTP